MEAGIRKDNRGPVKSWTWGARGSPGCFAGIHPAQGFSTCYYGHRKPHGSAAGAEEKRKEEEKGQGGRNPKKPWLRIALQDGVLSSLFTPL